jgi:signal transduction histidine kinase
MGSMSKLLNKPLKIFTLYALLILAASIPAYYYVIDHIWLSELDENNQIVKERIEKGFQGYSASKPEFDSLLALWSKVQPGTKIAPATEAEVRPDSIYTRLNKSPYDKEANRFRALSAYIYLNAKPYHLVAEVNVEEADETMTAIGLVTILFFILLVAGFLILNRVIAGKLWQPFTDTLAKLKSFDLHKNKDVQFSKTDIEEFAELNTVLDKMIASNVAAYNQQKEFTENASHELQTPLAILKSKLDLLQQDTTFTEAQAEKVSALHIPLSQVSRINKNLLLLAKIENNQYADQEQVNLTLLIEDTVELLADNFQEKGLILQASIEKNVWVSGNKNLIEILVTNLLVNALRHSSGGGQVVVGLTAGAFSISNKGATALNTHSLFQRFKTASANTPGTGLGLAIVKEICNRYGWEISYDYRNERHTFKWQFS